VERLTGQPYGVAVTERIVRPLRLTLSYNPLRPADGTAATVLGLVAGAFCPAAR
jgi:CubicO group peptidase (beta-lactamase class C family)